MKYQGVVKWFSNKKGFGFIAPTSDDAPTKEEIFVHQTAIVTDGAYRTLKENDTVQFEMETEADTGKLKAVNVTNPDGSPIVPAPRERRPRRGKGESGGAESSEEAKEEGAKADKPKKSRGPRKPRNKGSQEVDPNKPPPPPKEPPFHASLNEDVKKALTDKGLELGKRTTLDVSVGDTRIKIGQGGYAGCALTSAVVGEGTYVCEPTGSVTFTWERSLAYKDGAWTTSDPKTLVSSISLSDASVSAVKPDETPETLWGKDIPEPMDAFEANGFLMRRVRLTRPRRVRAGDSK